MPLVTFDGYQYQDMDYEPNEPEPMREVFDPLCINYCDGCGVIIAKGEVYYAKPDDVLILCKSCFTNKRP